MQYELNLLDLGTYLDIKHFWFSGINEHSILQLCNVACIRKRQLFSHKIMKNFKI